MANKHTLEQRKFIVQMIAALEPPRTIAKRFCVKFPDTKCNENDVLALDPRNVLLPPELYVVWSDERKRMALDPNAAPFANPFLQMKLLSNYVEMYHENMQPENARAVLRQITDMQGTTSTKSGKIAGMPGEVKDAIGAIERRVVDPKPPEPVPA